MKHERIEINPKVMVGKPVIKGTRLPRNVHPPKTAPYSHGLYAKDVFS